MLVPFALIKRFGDRYRVPMFRIPGLRRGYMAVYRAVKPSGIVTLDSDVGPLRMNAADDVMFSAIAAYGVHEPEEAALLRERLKPGMVFVDAGANIGYYSRLAGQCVGADGRVIAFEPEPENASLLAENTRGVVAPITIVQQALSDRPGSLRLHRDRYNHGGHTLGEDNLQTVSDGSVDVEVTTIDEAFTTLGLSRIDFIKADIQGAEGAMLRGAEKAIAKFKPTMLLEFWPAGLRKMGTRPLDLLESLRSLGYQVRVQQGGRLSTLEDMSEVLEMAARHEYVNLLFEQA